MKFAKIFIVVIMTTVITVGCSSNIKNSDEETIIAYSYNSLYDAYLDKLSNIIDNYNSETGSKIKLLKYSPSDISYNDYIIKRNSEANLKKIIGILGVDEDLASFTGSNYDYSTFNKEHKNILSGLKSNYMIPITAYIPYIPYDGEWLASKGITDLSGDDLEKTLILNDIEAGKLELNIDTYGIAYGQDSVKYINYNNNYYVDRSAVESRYKEYNSIMKTARLINKESFNKKSDNPYNIALASPYYQWPANGLSPITFQENEVKSKKIVFSKKSDDNAKIYCIGISIVDANPALLNFIDYITSKDTQIELIRQGKQNIFFGTVYPFSDDDVNSLFAEELYQSDYKMYFTNITKKIEDGKIKVNSREVETIDAINKQVDMFILISTMNGSSLNDTINQIEEKYLKLVEQKEEH